MIYKSINIAFFFFMFIVLTLLIHLFGNIPSGLWVYK